MKLKDKVAVITGAAQGIGREYSIRFAEEGAAVALLDKRIEQARDVQKEIEAKGARAIAFDADVTNEKQMEQIAGEVDNRLGSIDVLINNAAMYYDIDLADASIEYGRKVMDVNVFGVLTATWAVVPYMIKRRVGSIINIASNAAWPGIAARAAKFTTITETNVRRAYYYGLSKAAVVHLTQAMAIDFGPYKIRVNALVPGVVLSEATLKSLPEQFIGVLREQALLGCTMEPRDMTGAAVFLASDDSGLMTSQCLVVDAGRKLW
jgi:NAD(P)-dependent dehydrogenase (short-subunit alcohol dehydrogenase family)